MLMPTLMRHRCRYADKTPPRRSLNWSSVPPVYTDTDADPGSLCKPPCLREPTVDSGSIAAPTTAVDIAAQPAVGGVRITSTSSSSCSAASGSGEWPLSGVTITRNGDVLSKPRCAVFHGSYDGARGCTCASVCAGTKHRSTCARTWVYGWSFACA
jgi:hypothetical protein